MGAALQEFFRHEFARALAALVEPELVFLEMGRRFSFNAPGVL